MYVEQNTITLFVVTTMYIEQNIVTVFVVTTMYGVQNVQPTSNLLAQLISKENLNTLIINLFPGNEGYSVMLRGRNGLETETVRLPYEVITNVTCLYYFQ